MKRALEVRTFSQGWVGTVYYVADVTQAKRERNTGRISTVFQTEAEATEALAAILAAPVVDTVEQPHDQ